MPPLPLPPPFRPPQLPTQPVRSPNNKELQLICSVELPPSSIYQTLPVGIHELQLRRVVKLEKTMVIIQEKNKEATPGHSKNNVTIQPIPAPAELPSSSN